jgi:hypothetical protein
MVTIINLDLTSKLLKKWKNMANVFISLFIFVLATGCGNKNLQSVGVNEIVLTPRMSIAAENINGNLFIQAGDNYHRSFTWKGETRSVDMLPRKERWNGSFGIYFPGRGNHWKEHDDITRAVIDEGILNFESLDRVLEFIDRYEDRSSLVYNDEGLFVYWDKSPGAGGTLNVQIWQLLIKGDKPNGIPGSENTKLTIFRK